MPSKLWLRIGWGLVLCAALAAQAQDLHVKKSITVGGNFVSSSESSIKGARERSVTQGPNGSTVTLRQCDLKRTITLNEQAQTYFVADDPQDENAAEAAALATGMPGTQGVGGKVTITTNITDTGERKKMYGYQARHLKAKVIQEPSADACTQVRQSFEIDGWFADISPEPEACATLAPPLQQGTGCHDVVVAKRVGSGKPGYPLQESITMPRPDGGTMTVGIQISEISKAELPADMFDVPAGYRQVKSLAELNGMNPAGVPQSAQAGAGQPAVGQQPNISAAQLMNPVTGPATQLAFQQQAMAQAAKMGYGANMPGMGGNQSATSVATPQALGPKAAGKIRIGVAPPDAQLGQGNNAGADYSTPVRNAEVALMSGPAIEIAALDSRVAMQLQAEAQQKQCDYILYSSVAVKHGGGGFGRFAKFGGMAASMTPMGAAMGGGMGGAIAAQSAGMAASAAAQAAAMSAQQQALSQLSGFNGQIKSKDEVTVQYQLVPAGSTSAVAQNSLKAKAKSDGEDVLTPLLQQTAANVLNSVSQK